MEDFSLFTQRDRQDLSYAMCVGGMTVAGGAVGRFAGLHGLLAGAIAGVVYGLATCRRLAPALERKLFSGTDRMSDDEVLQVLRLLAQQGGVHSKSDGMYVLSSIRHAAGTYNLDPQRVPKSCLPLRAAAAQILAARRAGVRG